VHDVPATELIHIAQAVLHEEGTIDEFIDTTFNFPTHADAYKYAAYDGLQRLQARPPHHGRCQLACKPDRRDSETYRMGSCCHAQTRGRGKAVDHSPEP
jgi:hypothetical protein